MKFTKKKMECFADHHFNLRLGERRIIEISSFCHFLDSSFTRLWPSALAFRSIISSKERAVKAASEAARAREYGDSKRKMY